MNRRAVLSLPAITWSLATSIASSVARAAAPRTHWTFKTSEGLDAIAFFGPLSGKPFYARYYEKELEAFKPRLSAEVMQAIDSMYVEADRDGYLLWPRLTLILSGGPTDTIDDLLASISSGVSALKEKFASGPYASVEDWAQFESVLPRLTIVLTGLRDSGFAEFARDRFKDSPARITTLTDRFASMDVIARLEHLSGRELDPNIELDLLWFCRPHSAKIQGQRFVVQADAPDAVIVLTAAHEPMHPPFDMNSATARRCIEILDADPLVHRILAEKSRDSGYNTVDGLFEEDVVQALDQMTQEHFGFGKPPVVRWSASDEAMHFVAAALYGMLKADGYDRSGGNIQAWLDDAVKRQRFAPAALHAMAAKVMQRPVEKLWITPLAPSPSGRGLG
jgi:hypothetical protein